MTDAGMRCVVIGGGVIGWTVAWRLAAVAPSAQVTVVDPSPGRGASWTAAGMLAPVSEANLGEEDLLALNVRALRRWPDFVEELAAASGCAVDLRTTGTVIAALDADDHRELDELAERLVALDLQVERLRRRQLRQRVPALSPGVRGGLDATSDHAVDNRQVVRALRTAGERAGVAHVAAAASGVDGDADGITGVSLTDGHTLPADVVVAAAGVATGELELPTASPPVRPVKGQLLRLRDDPTAPLLPRVVRGRARGRVVYLVPRTHGEVVVGATVEEVGHDTDVTAGGILDLLTAAAELVPGIRELPVVETRAGLRPGTPDNAPLVGPTDVPGLVVATGHFRQGILQAPITGDAVARLVTTGHMPDGFDAFAPGRFAVVEDSNR